MRVATNMTKVIVASALIAGLSVTVPANASRCDLYASMAFGPFPIEASSTPPVFGSGEGDPGVFRVFYTGVDCGSYLPITAAYGAIPGSASEPGDYVLPAGRTEQLCGSSSDPSCPSERSVPFAVVNDTEPESVGSFVIQLSEPDGGSLSPPTSVGYVIVDDDGPSRISFDDRAYGVSESRTVLAVPVWRSGSAAAPASATLHAQPGPGAGATAGDDYTLTTTSLTFAPGERMQLATLSVVNDPFGEPTETVELTLEGDAIASPSSTVVTIEDNEEGIPPVSRFHHPRHKKRYTNGDYRLREFHVFHADYGGSGTAAVEVALRMKKTNGACRWFDGKRFRRGPCGERRWVDTGYYQDLDWYYLRVPKLKPSVRTKIKHYTAYARAIDAAGNVEQGFGKKRNLSRFEVRKQA